MNTGSGSGYCIMSSSNRAPLCKIPMTTKESLETPCRHEQWRRVKHIGILPVVKEADSCQSICVQRHVRRFTRRTRNALDRTQGRVLPLASRLFDKGPNARSHSAGTDRRQIRSLVPSPRSLERVRLCVRVTRRLFGFGVLCFELCSGTCLSSIVCNAMRLVMRYSLPPLVSWSRPPVRHNHGH